MSVSSHLVLREPLRPCSGQAQDERSKRDKRMSVKVRIPMPLRGLTQDKDVVSGDGGTLAACIEALESAYPGLKERICDEAGGPPRVVGIYIHRRGGGVLGGLA